MVISIKIDNFLVKKRHFGDPPTPNIAKKCKKPTPSYLEKIPSLHLGEGRGELSIKSQILDILFLQIGDLNS